MSDCITCVVYPGCEIFIDDYLKAIYNQSNKEFALLIFSDGIENDLLVRRLKNYNIYNYEIIEIPPNLTIAKNREFCLKTLIELSYEKIIFTDVDDIIKFERFDKIIKLLDKYDFVINDMEVIIENRRYKVLEENKIPSHITYKDLLYRNFAGFGNTGIRKNLIKYFLPIPYDILAVDWWMVTISSLLNFRIYFHSEPLTFYRQHQNNYIGIGKAITKERLYLSLNVKKNHYKRINQYQRISSNYKILFDNLYKKMINIENYISNNDNLKRYLFLVNKKMKNKLPLWWEYVISLEKMEI